MRALILASLFVTVAFAGDTNSFVPFVITPAPQFPRDFKQPSANLVELIDALKAAAITNGITLGQVVTNLGPGSIPAWSGTGTILWSFADGRVLCVSHCTDASTVLSSEPNARHRFWFMTNAVVSSKK